MFFSILFVIIFQIFVFETIGFSIKKILRIKFPTHNLLIGYIGSILIFYILSGYFIINQYSFAFISRTLFSIFLFISAFLVIFSLKNRKLNINFYVLVVILLYIFHFFSLTFITTEESANYLTSIYQINNLDIFQTYTRLHADLFKLNSNIYVINVLTFINLFIILFSIYECFLIFFNSKKKALYANIFFLFIFTLLNSTVKNLALTYNAHHFLYHPYTGLSVYLYAIIPFQFALIYRLRNRAELLLLMINLGSMGFTSISVITQLIFNTAYILILMFTKQYHSQFNLKTLIFVTILPLFFSLFLFNYASQVFLMFLIIFILLMTLSLLISYQHRFQKFNLTNAIFLSLILILFIIYWYVYPFIKIRISKNTIENLNSLYQNFIAIILLFNGLAIYSLIRLRKINIERRIVFVYLPIIILFLIFNPISIYFILELNINMVYLIFLSPIVFSIIYLFINHASIIEKLLIVLLVIAYAHPIYQRVTPITQTKQNLFYRMDEDILTVSNFLNENPEIKNIIVCADLINIITINTNVNLLNDNNNFNNEDLILLTYTINDKIPFDYISVTEAIETYEIDAIIIDKYKMVNSDLELLSNNKQEFTYYVIYRY